MSLRVDQDHARFKHIVRGRIRQNLRRYISQGRAARQAGQGAGLDPHPADRHPALPLRRQAARRRRPGRRRAGRPARRAPATARARAQAGSAEGEHVLEVDVTLDELARDPRRRARAAQHRGQGQEPDRRQEGPLRRHAPRRPQVAAPLQAHVPRGAQAPDCARHLRPEAPGRSSRCATTSATARGRPRSSRSPTPSSST